jgi:hypothetical protein
MSSVNLGIAQRDSRRIKTALTKGWLLLMVCGICLEICGCKNPEVVWSAESKSPDGKMVAKGQAFANGGFGVSGIPATFVYLNWATGSQKPKEILEFANESDTTAGEAVEIKWLSPTQLEVAYRKDKQEVQFQAVKFGDIAISLRDLSSDTTNSSR